MTPSIMHPHLRLWEPVLGADFFKALDRHLNAAEERNNVEGLVEGARSLVLALLARRASRRILLVVPDDHALELYRRDLSAWSTLVGRKQLRVAVMPALEADPYDDIPPHPEVVRERVVTLGRLARDEVDVLLVPVRALMHWLPSRDEWLGRSRVVAVGDELPPDRFMLDCLASGYRRVDTVSAQGEISRRGGIVDIFPPSAEEPVRIELFGDTVDSLRSFDTDNQRSTGALQRTVVDPAMESALGDDGMRRLQRFLERGTKRITEGGASPREFRQRLDVLQNEGYWPGIEALTGLTAGEKCLVFDHARGFRFVIDEPERCEEELARAAHEIQATYDDSDNRMLPPPAELFPRAMTVRDRLREAILAFEDLGDDRTRQSVRRVQASTRSVQSFSGRIPALVEALRQAARDGRRTVCIMRAAGGAERLQELLDEYEIAAVRGIPQSFTDEDPWSGGGLFVLIGALQRGFEFPDGGLAVITEREIFGEAPKARERKRTSHAVFLSDFRDLKHGDTVVHVDHGIARYTGLGRPRGGSLNRDFMTLEFAGGDRLFVPVDRLDLVQKYRGVGGQRPRLDRLGGPGWERVKSRVRKSVESMAKELLELYARRQATRRKPFGPDTHWQEEFEGAFPHDETPDQKRSIEEIKADMESERPMDRLLVGDVGFGKTEVALRAAFKAVMEGTQVAVLTPTTVLASQHYERMRERLRPFAFKVEMVSRFRTAAENREVLKRVSEGEVDVVVGTHRLLSKDVSFRKLGLLVVDEEQRFGVTHKERLKQLSVGVDALAMTATPIPRTLQMSLAGVRDLSIIESAPPGRMAIQTYITSFRKNVLAQAIRQELRRDGQVFVVHNRVETLPAMTKAVREMVPEARVETAHGQMPEKKLEAVMLRFVNYEADVLVTTTIVENGLDIPRANTLIVNRADRFGLSQLYQLRGRVGRSDLPAYAYFIVPSRQGLSEVARKRLLALKEFSDLGSGFRLAAADLEIRGAGEFLGTRQHGHIASLGFDLYCQMLERAVHELQGEEVSEVTPPTLHLGIDFKIPEKYMAEAGDRLALYKRLAGARRPADVERLQAETEDRYGHLPPAVKNLTELTQLRLLGEQLGVKSVDVVDGRLQIRFHERPKVDLDRVLRVIRDDGGSITPSGMLIVPAPPRAAERIDAVRGLFEELTS